MVDHLNESRALRAMSRSARDHYQRVVLAIELERRHMEDLQEELSATYRAAIANSDGPVEGAAESGN